MTLILLADNILFHLMPSRALSLFCNFTYCNYAIKQTFWFYTVLFPAPVKYFLSCHSSHLSYCILSVSIHLPFRLEPSRITLPSRCIFVSVRLIVAAETASASPNAL